MSKPDFDKIEHQIEINRYHQKNANGFEMLDLEYLHELFGRNADTMQALYDALQYCAGRMEHPRCPRCADRQEVAKQALDNLRKVEG